MVRSCVGNSISSGLNISFFLWTVVDCGTLTSTANGQIRHANGTTFRQTATHSCDTGYILMGESTRMCQATGVWSGSAPICQGMLLLEFSMPGSVLSIIYFILNTRKNKTKYKLKY